MWMSVRFSATGAEVRAEIGAWRPTVFAGLGSLKRVAARALVSPAEATGAGLKVAVEVGGEPVECGVNVACVLLGDPATGLGVEPDPVLSARLRIVAVEAVAKLVGGLRRAFGDPALTPGSVLSRGEPLAPLLESVADFLSIASGKYKVLVVDKPERELDPVQQATFMRALSAMLEEARKAGTPPAFVVIATDSPYVALATENAEHYYFARLPSGAISVERNATRPFIYAEASRLTVAEKASEEEGVEANAN